MCFPYCFIVSTAEVAFVERWGKFERLAQPGFQVVCFPYEQVVGKLNFRVQQLNVRVETKTLDNVFLEAVVSVQYQVLRDRGHEQQHQHNNTRGRPARTSIEETESLIPEAAVSVEEEPSVPSANADASPTARQSSVWKAFYALTNPKQQITAHVYDVMRSQLPTMELDAVFEAKEELAMAVKRALADTMMDYGYQIVQVLITDIEPNARVKAAMNEINASKRLKYAVAEKAEGDKILQVKSAEAEAEAKYLSGVGVAKQRKAIVDGLRSSIVDFQGSVHGSSTKEVMDLLLLTQYFDMVRDVGSANHCKTTFVPSPRGPGDSTRNALLQVQDS